MVQGNVLMGIPCMEVGLHANFASGICRSLLEGYDVDRPAVGWAAGFDELAIRASGCGLQGCFVTRCGFPLRAAGRVSCLISGAFGCWVCLTCQGCS